MKWANLKQNKCPKCDKEFSMMSFADFEKTGKIICFSVDCTFSIFAKRFQEIVNSQVSASLERQWEQEYQDNLL